MAVEKEWRCRAHGEFENATGICSACKSKRWVVQEFRTPFKHIGAKTKNSDKVVRQLAMDYNMSDVKNDKAGGSVMDAMRKGNPMPAMNPSQVMQNYRTNPTKQSAWLGSAPPGAFGGMGGENALSRVPLGKPAPQYVARDAGEYRK
jgi:hypothetical protein